jgi:hypothetical protein
MNQDLYGKNDIRHASLDRVECSQNTLHYLQVKLARDTHYCYETYGKGRGIPRSGFYTMHEFIKRAIYLREQRKLVEPFSLDFITNQYETYLLNTMWIQFSTRIGRPLGATIPILDVSLSMASSDEFYSAIGYAYLISEHSDINNRIIAFSHQTEWILSGPIEPPETTGFVDDIYNGRKIETINHIYATFLENINNEPGTVSAKDTNKTEISRFFKPMSVTRKTLKMGINTAILNSPTESSLLVKITPTTLHLPQDLLQLIS